MRRILTGGITALSIWIGSALAAEAQQITPTGPLAIYQGSTSTTFTATVTLPYVDIYGVQLSVYKDGSQTPFCTTEVWVYNVTSTTSTYTQQVMLNPLALLGHSYRFHAVLCFGSPVQYYPNADPDWLTNVTVRPSGPTSYVEPSQVRELALESIDRDRRLEA